MVDRMVELLHALTRGPQSLTELSNETGLPKATALRLLKGLAARNFVDRDPETNTYSLGPDLSRLAQRALDPPGALTPAARSILADLAAHTGETVAVHVRVGLERRYVAEIASGQAVRYSALVGSASPIHSGGAGVVLLAFTDPASSQEILNMLELIEGVDLADLKPRLESARVRGWVIDIETRLAGASAICVPVRSRSALLALSVIGPSSRLPEARLKRFRATMEHAAAELAVELDSPDSARPLTVVPT